MTKVIDELAPPSIALKDDPVGLQVGRFDDEVRGIIITLDVESATVRLAEESGANLIVSHHPLIFSPLSSINYQTPGGALIRDIIAKGFNVYSAHTNLDIAPGGVNSVLAGLFGLKNTEIIEITGHDPLIKLVVFVPEGYEEAVRDAVSEAGAGWIGNYSHCTFQAAGTGTFLPRDGSNPYIGSQGNLEKVSELRLETVFPDSARDRVLGAMLKSHPYEEVAYDLYPLANHGVARGLGLVGELSEISTLKELTARCGELLQTGAVRGWGEKDKKVLRVAVCGGSGGTLIKEAILKKADVFISGDFKYHDISLARSEGLALIDAGHYATEYPIVNRLADYLKDKLAGGGHRIKILATPPADEIKNLIKP